MTRQPHILWADDEIDILKPHILFLEGKNYKVTGVNSGNEALEEIEQQAFDVVFLDENMPGINGIETLQRMKEKRPHCLLYTSPSPRDRQKSRMPSSA